MRFELGQKIIDRVRHKEENDKNIVVKNNKLCCGNKHIYEGSDSNGILYKELMSDTPSLICRFGRTEFSCLNFYIQNNLNHIDFPEDIANEMSNNAGFFNANNYYLSRFSSEMLEIIPNIDVLGFWFLPNEENIVNKFAPKAKLIKLRDLDPKCKELQTELPDGVYPFTKAFENKKILVIHPFVETIKQQYERREHIFYDKNVLPNFELKTIKAVQTIAGNNDTPYKNWFEALDSMKEQIDKTDFDIALIGCGAYGIFLADYCKRIGKKALHAGGATQLYFGIKGKRWEDRCPNNEFWVYPSENEKPKNLERVEGGCYW